MMTDSHIKVSVIVPVYNAMPYLTESLDSLLGQTLEEIEIICVDDCSTDGSLEEIIRRKELDNRVRLLKNDRNVGAGASRNRGLCEARGEYVAILDADDLFDKNMLKKKYEKAFFTKAEIVCCDYYECDKYGKSKYEIRLPQWFSNLAYSEGVFCEDADKYKLAVMGGMAWRNMYSRFFLEHNNLRFQEVYNCDDFFFTGNALILSNRIAYMGYDEKPLLYYRTGTNTSQRKKMRDLYSPYRAGKALVSVTTKKEEYKRYRSAAFSSAIYVIWAWSQSLADEQIEDYAFPLIENGIKSIGVENWTESDFYHKDDMKRLIRTIDDTSKVRSIYDTLGLFLFDIPKLFDELRCRKCKCALWGCGNTGKIFLRACEMNNYTLEEVYDISPKMIGNKIGEYVVKNSGELREKDVDIVLVTNYKYISSVIAGIKALEMKIPVFDVMSYCRFGIPFEKCIYGIYM